MIQIYLTCLDWTWSVLTWLDLSQLDLSCLDLSWLYQCWLTILPFRHPINTFQTPSRHLPDTLRTPSRHLPDTRQTPSRHYPYTLQTPTRQSPKFRHVGSFLLLKARCGLFLLVLLLLKPTEVELSLQVGVEFDKITASLGYFYFIIITTATL